MAFAGDEPLIYDGSSTDLAPETRPLEAQLAHYVQEGHKRLRVAFPAAVASIEGDQTVDLQPLLKVRYAGQEPSTMPQLKSVPVVMPQGGDWRISMPLAVGDTGLALVTDRSLDAWLAGKGGVTDPNDTRTHHLADAVFIPGLVPTNLQTTDTSSDLVLQNGQASIRLQKNGHIRFGNAGQELIDLMHQTTQAMIDTLAQLQSALVLTAFGPAPFSAAAIQEFLRIQTEVRTLLQELDTFKST